MTKSDHLDQFVSILSSLTEAVDEMRQHYVKIPELIRAEHEAITQAEIDRVEEISRLKLEVGSLLDADFSRIKDCVRDFANLVQKDGGELPEHVLQLSDCFVLMEERIKHFAAQGIDVQVIKTQFAQLNTSFDKFLSLKKESQSSVEVNKLVLAQLLANRQENYRFWQEISAETAAAYDGSGKKRDQQNRSTLTVKA